MTATTAAVYGRQSRGKEKSIDEQVSLCTADAQAQGWTVTATYRDRTSASRYRRRDRQAWAAVVEAVATRTVDVLVLWASSRGDRDLTSWSGLLDACRQQGVLIRITDDERTYDPRRSGDWQALAQQGVGNAVDSDKLSAAVRRGLAGAAAQGKPAHGRAPYGYRRRHDERTGQLVAQEVDEQAADVVRDIVARVANGVPISVIAEDLNRRGVPTVGAARWYRQRVRDIAGNVAYIGVRQHNGQQHKALWPAIVEPDVFWAAQRVLGDPSRLHTRPGRQVHLLSYLGECAECGSPLCVVKGRYRCLDRGCVHVSQTATDSFVVAAVLARLARPDLYGRLQRAGQDADRIAVAARADVDRYQEELHRWRVSAARGQTSPESLAVVETELLAKVADAQRRAEQATVPPALRDLLQPRADVATRWAAMPVSAQREAVRTLALVRVSRAGRPGVRTFDAARLGASSWVGDSRTWAQIWERHAGR